MLLMNVPCWAQVAERRTPLGSLLSSPVAAMALALAASAAGLIPTAAPAYDAVWTYVMPLAAALSLLETDLRRLKDSAGPTLAAFVIGGLGTISGTCVAWATVGSRLGPEGWKLAAALCASYIGGSVNMAAVAAGLSVPGPALAAAMAADNVAMAGYLCIIMGIAKRIEVGPGDRAATEPAGSSGQGFRSEVTAESISLSLAAAALACAGGGALAARLGFSSGSLALMALLATAVAMAGAGLSRGSPGADLSAQDPPASPFSGKCALPAACLASCGRQCPCSAFDPCSACPPL